MSFSNPIVAGEELIRSAIKSENYVAGSSGWRIARDGDAEFNDVTVRGELFVAGDSPPDEYIRIYQELGVPTIEWSTESGEVWESYAHDDAGGGSLKISSASGAGIRWMTSGEIVFHQQNLGDEGVYFDENDGYLKRASSFVPTAPETWHNLPLINGWAAHDETPQYRQMPDGTVMLKGNLTGGTTADGTVFGQLPVGYRPLTAHRCITAEKQTGVDYRHVRVSTNGDVDVWKCTTAHICIDGVRFPVI